MIGNSGLIALLGGTYAIGFCGCGGGSLDADAQGDGGADGSHETGDGDAGTDTAGDAGLDGEIDPMVELIDATLAPAIDAEAPDDLETCIGAVAAAVLGDRAVVRGYGATEAHGATLPDGDTIFQIGSITKFFTGLGLARLVAEGEVTPDDLVPPTLGPELQAPLADQAFTFAHLVTHRAGFPPMPANMIDRDLDGSPDAGADPLSPGTGYSRSDLARFLDAFVPESAPGETYLYSNLGLGLLGLSLEDHLGVGGYEDLLRTLVTADLGMRDTWGEVDAIDPAATSRIAQGYATEHGGRVPGRLGQMGVLAGAGEIVTTGNDMLVLLAAVTGISPTALDAAVDHALVPLAAGPAGAEVGYAIEVEHLPEGDRYGKGGNTSSYSAYLSFRRRPQVGVIVMCNCGGFAAVKDLARGLGDGLAALGE